MTTWKNAAVDGPIFSGRPFAVAAVRARHMIGDGGMATPIGRTGVAGDPLSLVEEADRSVSVALSSHPDLDRTLTAIN